MPYPRPCPVCGGKSASNMHRHEFVVFDGHPLAGTCVTACCNTCGMGFNRSTATADAYIRYYAELSKYDRAFSPHAASNHFSSLVEIFADIFPNRDLSILDVGFGGGGLLAALQQQGYTHLAGMDPSPMCVESLSRQLGIKARVGYLAAPSFAPGSFDVIVSTGVLEHLLEPAGDLTGMKSLLKPDGMVFIAVPDVDRYAEFMTAPFQEFNIEHVNHFSRSSLEQLFALRGWSCRTSGQSVLNINPSWRESIVYGAFRFNSGSPQSPTQDGTAPDRLRRYISASDALLERIDKKLRAELAEEHDYMLWGAGQFCSTLLEMTVLSEKRPRAVIDSNPAYYGKSLLGAPVGPPDIRGDFSGPIVVATIREHETILQIIRKKLGWKNRILTL